MPEIPWQSVRVLGVILVQGPPVALYVYRDRRREGESHPAAWAAGVGLLGVAGLLLYLHRRGKFAPE